MEIEMKVKGLVVDPISKMPIVVLENPRNEQILPIWIGVFEANAIALTIENVPTPRPMTHDLLKSFLEKLDIAIEKIVVNDVRNTRSMPSSTAVGPNNRLSSTPVLPTPSPWPCA
jgi:bifunctional DNase/RNase